MKGLVLDTETTGLKDPQVIELAYLPVSENLTLDSNDVYCALFKPNKEIEPKALEVHGIAMSKLEDKPSTTDLKIHAPEVFSDKYIIGHNISYDVGAICNSVGNTQFKTICTKKLALYAFPNQSSYSLVNLTKSLDSIKVDLTENAHRADTDVLMTYNLLIAIADELEVKTGEKHTLDMLYDLSLNMGHIPYNEYANIIRKNRNK